MHPVCMSIGVFQLQLMKWKLWSKFVGWRFTSYIVVAAFPLFYLPVNTYIMLVNIQMTGSPKYNYASQNVFDLAYLLSLAHPSKTRLQEYKNHVMKNVGLI